MFFRVVKRQTGGKAYQYLHLVESVREERGPRQRLLHSFGSLDQLSSSQRQRLVHSLTRALGLPQPSTTTEPPDLIALDARHYADVLALRTLWDDLQLPATLRRLAASRNIEFDLDLLAFVMAAHRLIDPGSKLALIRWLPTACLQGHHLEAIQLQHCYRALDLLAESRYEIEEALFLRLSDLFDRELSVVFYDLTSTYFEGDGPSQAAYGYSRDRRGDQKQLILALAVDRRGLPITHLVFEGNRVDHQTLQEAVGHLQQRFCIERTIFVADGGVMTDHNIEHLVASGFQHLIAVPKRRAIVRELASGIEWTIDDAIGENVMARRIVRDQISYLVCYNPERAEQEAQIRDRRLDRTTRALEDLRRQVAEGRLVDHDKIVAAASAILATSRTRRCFDVHFAGDGQFEFALRQDALAQAQSLEGYYFLQTDAAELDASDMLSAYKTLQQVEHAFRELKDTIELRPIYHYADDRVRGHIFVCLLAYLLERLLELRLEAAQAPQSARAALDKLEPIRAVTNQLDDRTLTCIVQRHPAGADAILKALGLHHLPVVLSA